MAIEDMDWSWMGESYVCFTETFDADAVVQTLEQAGAKVCDPTAYVCKAVERVRRGGMPGIGIRSRCFTCGEPGHLARDCPSDAGGGDFQRTRVFVAGLDPAVQWYDLKDFFREAGFDVVYASVSAHADGSSKGCGVVQLASAGACDAAIRDLNGAALRGAAIAVREDRQERRRRGRGEAPPRAAARDAFSDRRGAFDEFGGLLPWVGAENGPLPAEVLALLADRDDARDAKDYAAADAIRDDVRDLYELRIDDRNRRCLPHAPPVAPRAPPTATVKAESD